MDVMLVLSTVAVLLCCTWIVKWIVECVTRRRWVLGLVVFIAHARRLDPRRRFRNVLIGVNIAQNFARKIEQQLFERALRTLVEVSGCSR